MFIIRQLLKIIYFIKYNISFYNLNNLVDGIIICNQNKEIDKNILYIANNKINKSKHKEWALLNGKIVFFFLKDINIALELAKKYNRKLIPCCIKGKYKRNQLKVIFEKPVDFNMSIDDIINIISSDYKSSI